MPCDEGGVLVGGGACVRVVVVGGEGVGKSALAVRFLTKRYIGEYQQNKGWSILFFVFENHNICYQMLVSLRPNSN